MAAGTACAAARQPGLHRQGGNDLHEDAADAARDRPTRAGGEAKLVKTRYSRWRRDSVGFIRS